MPKEITLNGKWNGRFKDPSNPLHSARISGLAKQNGMCCMGVACHEIWNIPPAAMERLAFPHSQFSDDAGFLAFLGLLRRHHSLEEYISVVGLTVTARVASASLPKWKIFEHHRDDQLGLREFIAAVNDDEELSPYQKARAIQKLFSHYLGIAVTYKPGAFE